ncbi:MAG: hypothetical protein AMJ70_08705 [Dehalococcoidia bacterium SG8_51_3]|nr:MAG: hypothetical protein AMJ70_08705 [Dehalococcoidia bacterium SG8_51_3]
MKRKWLLAPITTLIIFIILDVSVVTGHAHFTFPWSHIPGFFSFFGFLGCLAIIYGAKLLGHFWLQRGEDYYDKDDEHE